jgi:hypothetical protein
MLSNKGSSMYNEVQSFWSVEGLAELAGGPTVCGDVAKRWVFTCLELQCDKVNCTHGCGEEG